MPRPKKTVPAKSPVAAAVEVVETVKEKTAKAAAKKVEAVYVQVGGSEWDISDCKERAVADYKAGRRAAVKTLKLYIKPEEGKAYYVINDQNGSIDL